MEGTGEENGGKKRTILQIMKQVMEDMNFRMYEQLKRKAERRPELRIAAN